MANVRTTKIGLSDSIKLYEGHYQYWENYEDSTMLVDPWYNIIWYYDHWTPNIDVIMTSLPFQGGFIIKNGVPEDYEWVIKYNPYDYKTAYLERQSEIDRLKEKRRKDKRNDKLYKTKLTKIYLEINDKVERYNREYFTNTFWWKKNSKKL